MKILLIGNKGQIGREIENSALERGIQVIGFDIDSLDITNSQLVNEVFKGNADVDVVINAAAYTAVDKAQEETNISYAVNCDGVRNLAIACRDNDLPLLHISTDYVFDGDKDGRYSEDDATNPLGIYGKDKLAGEQALSEVWTNHIILRVSWVFGRYGSNFVKTILRLACEREELSIVGDQYGCPTPAADAARVLLEIAEKISNGQHSWGVYNYCGSPVTSWFNFAKKIIVVAREKMPLKVKQINSITTEEYPTKAIRPGNSELLVDKLIKNYGILRHDWESYLLAVIDEVIG